MASIIGDEFDHEGREGKEIYAVIGRYIFQKIVQI